MKKSVYLIAILYSGIIFSQPPSSVNSDATIYAETITVADLKEDLTILASDALEGRETGKRGQKMAAAYIKTHFEELGLVGPVKGTGSPYYQNVPLKVVKPGEIYVTINGARLNNIDEVLYSGQGNTNGEVPTEVVFIGEGSEADFEKNEVKGKSILIYNTDRNGRVLASKLAKEQGVQMIFSVRGSSDEEFKVFQTNFGSYFSSGTMKLDKDESKEVGMFYLRPSVAAGMLNTSFDKIEKAIDAAKNGEKNPYKKLKSEKIGYQLDFENKKIVSENVLGFLEGTDLKEEVLVLTSHYDHEGIKNGEIYNGADDDGSGTVAVMDIAEAFVKAKEDGKGPRRSILFMTVTAEEKGLLGSEYYADNPIFPLENTVANLNIDMIGRIDDRELKSENYVSLVGSDKLSTELHAISEKANSTYTNLFLDYTYNDEGHPERIYYRSDHWNFAKNGIPVIFYTTGSHPDYHKPTDTVEKIEFELMTARAKLVFYTAWEIVNRDGRLIVDKK
jgi:hypothetical protein